MKKWVIKKVIKWFRNDDFLRKELLNLAIKDLYNTIGIEDILKVEGGKWIFEGRPLTEHEVMQLKGEATAFQNMKLWKILNRDIAYQLNKKMFLEATVVEDLVWGKLLTFLWDIVKTRIQTLK